MQQPDPQSDKAASVAWLTDETASSLQLAANNDEGLRAAAFLFTNRAREAGLTTDEMATILGISIARANLTERAEASVLDTVESLDPIATAVHAIDPAPKPRWKFWS
jgi:hypothetical protein